MTSLVLADYTLVVVLGVIVVTRAVMPIRIAMMFKGGVVNFIIEVMLLSLIVLCPSCVLTM